MNARPVKKKPVKVKKPTTNDGVASAIEDDVSEEVRNLAPTPSWTGASNASVSQETAVEIITARPPKAKTKPRKIKNGRKSSDAPTKSSKKPRQERDTKASATSSNPPAPASVRASRKELDEHGFVPFSDSSIIASALVEGGMSRGDVTRTAEMTVGQINGLKTRNGTPKNVQSLTAGILTRLLEKGYTIESTYRVVPPAHRKENQDVTPSATTTDNAVT